MAWPDCVGSKTIPEPNCAFAAGCISVANPRRTRARIGFFIVKPLHRRWVCVVHSGTALLLCGNNFSLNLRKMVSLRLTPCFAFLFLGFKVCHLFLRQRLTCQQP